jgi:hypothetical protein
VGNELRLTAELYSILTERIEEERTARAAAQAAGEASPATRGRRDRAQSREESVSLIDLDLPRTFPMLSFFQEGGPMNGALGRMLGAFASYRPDIGYVQGMTYIGALFLLNLDEYDAFVAITNMMASCPSLLHVYRMQPAVVAAYMRLIRRLMRKHVSKIASLVEAQCLTIEAFVVDWILTVFAKALPIDVAARMWDLIIVEGEHMIFKGILGLLKYFQRDLIRSSFEHNMAFLTHLPEDRINADALIKEVESIKLTADAFAKARNEELRVAEQEGQP